MARKPKQLEFLGHGFFKPSAAFGGSLLKGNPKTKRPLDSKLPISLTLRASKSCLRLPKTFGSVSEIIRSVAQKHGVRIYERANAGNHLHFLLKIPSLGAWAAFIRELTGRIAQVVMELAPGTSAEKFWKFRPHTRIVRGWQKAFRTAREYIQLNQLEAEGHISRLETKSLKDLRAIFADG